MFKPDYSKPKGVYNYAVFLSSGETPKHVLQEAMQKDLKNTFGYEVTVETRPVACWKLIATETAKSKLRTKGGFRASKVITLDMFFQMYLLRV